MRKMIYLISAAITVFLFIIVGDIEFYYMTGQNEKQAIVNHDSKLNSQYVSMLNDCMQFQTLDSLTSCKSSISHLKDQCQTQEYSDTEVCRDPRIDQFLDTVDFRITSAHNQEIETLHNLNDSISRIVNLCSQSYVPSCQANMIELKQECNSEELGPVQACRDPRIDQIIASNVNHTAISTDYFQDQVLSFIDSCTGARGNDSITTCATVARQVMSLCHSSQATACNDGRLQQIANMGLNSAIIAKIDQLNGELQTVLDKCYSRMLNQTECAGSQNIINESCNSNLKPYFPICYDPRIQNMVR